MYFLWIQLNPNLCVIWWMSQDVAWKLTSKYKDGLLMVLVALLGQSCEKYEHMYFPYFLLKLMNEEILNILQQEVLAQNILTKNQSKHFLNHCMN